MEIKITSHGSKSCGMILRSFDLIALNAFLPADSPCSSSSWILFPVAPPCRARSLPRVSLHFRSWGELEPHHLLKVRVLSSGLLVGEWDLLCGGYWALTLPVASPLPKLNLMCKVDAHALRVLVLACFRTTIFIINHRQSSLRYLENKWIAELHLIERRNLSAG